MEDKIINRIKKMLALANDAAAAEGERDNAMRMAYNLLAKHNLTMATVEGHTNEEKREQNAAQFYGRPWALTVAHAVAGLFFCQYFYMRSGTRNQVHHYFVGKQSNSVTALEMTKYLVESIKKEANQRMRAEGEGAAYRRSFSLGAANKIRQRINELKAEATKPKGTGTSLVLASLYDTEREANLRFLEELGIRPRESKGRGKSSVKVDAYHNGQQFGGTLSLSRQVSGGTRALQG